MDKIYDKCCGIDVHKNSSLPAFEKATGRRYGSLVQQPESFLKWLTGSKKAAVKWSL